MDQPSSTESNALTLRIRFKSASLEDFIGRYAVDVSPGGIFIRTKQPVEVGTVLQFDFSLADGSSLLSGLGTVAWVREHDPARANSVPGMGLRFDKLTPDSQQRHQAILAEKARKDGKPVGTPYPPTAFVVPPPRPSPSPDSTRTTAETAALKDVPTKQDVAPVPPTSFSKTLPAPAAALMARMREPTNDVDEFDAGGKTEISEKPVEYYMKEVEAAGKAGDSVPNTPLEDWKTDAHDMVTASGGPPAPEEVAVSDSQAYATEVPASPSSTSASGERRVSSKQSFAALLDLGDTVENQGAGETAEGEASSGVPTEFPTSEKTEEVSFVPQKAGEEGLEAPLDLNASMSEDEEVPSLAEVDEATVAPKRRSVGVAVAAVVLAAAAAFAAVYLLQTKPWQSLGQGEGPVAVVKKLPTVTPTAEPAPAPTPAAVPGEKAATPPTAAAEPAAKPAVVPEKAVVEKAMTGKTTSARAAAKKAAAEKAEAEKAAAEKAAAEKAAAGKAAAEKAAAEKAVAEKAAAEKAVAEKAAAKTEGSASKPAGKPSGRGATAAEKSSAAGVEGEEVYRMAFKSSPIGAEVLIDGEYYARTPCQRRILDPKKLIPITVRKAGYEPFEHMVGPSDHWAKRGNERILSISVRLKKAAKPAVAPEGVAPAPPAAPEPEPAAKPETEEPEPAKE